MIKKVMKNIFKFSSKILFGIIVFYFFVDFGFSFFLYNKANNEYDKVFLYKWPITVRALFSDYEIPRKYKDNEIDIFAFVSVTHRNVVFSKPIDKGQLTIVDEHMKNNDAVKNIKDILEDLN